MFNSSKTSFFKNFLEQFVRAYNTIVLFVHVKAVVMYIFLDKYHTCFVVDQVSLALVKELDKVVISQIAQDPLDPDHIILMLKFKLLQTNLVETKTLNKSLSYFSTFGDSTYSLALSS